MVTSPVLYQLSHINPYWTLIIIYMCKSKRTHWTCGEHAQVCVCMDVCLCVCFTNAKGLTNIDKKSNLLVARTAMVIIANVALVGNIHAHTVGGQKEICQCLKNLEFLSQRNKGKIG